MAVPGMTGGEQKPLVKYNAKTGQWQIDDKVVTTLTMLVDMEHAEAGWAKFAEGVAPDFRMTTMASMVAGGAYPQMPTDVDQKGKPLFRRAFRVMVKIPDKLAAGKASIREWASNSLATVRSVDRLHTAWLAGRQDGKVPVVTMTGTLAIPGAFGSNQEPVLSIVKWIDRPAGFGPDASPATPESPPPSITDPLGEPEVFDDADANEPW
jgi:hypothetical protein